MSHDSELDSFVEKGVELCLDAMAIFDGENMDRVKDEFRQVLRQACSFGTGGESAPEFCPACKGKLKHQRSAR